MSMFLAEIEMFLEASGLNPEFRREPDFIRIISPKAIFFASFSWLKKGAPELPGLIITEDEWFRNKEAVKSRIFSLLNKTRRIHGRECDVRLIPRAIAKSFIDQNHIMGYARSASHYGLYHRDKKMDMLVAVASFSKGRKMKRLPEAKLSFELIRFCNLNYTTVVGGLSKLLAFFIIENKPGDIITYIDLAWGEPTAFYALGFHQAEERPAIDFFINTKTYQRIPAKDLEADPGKDWIRYKNKGTLKLIKRIASES
jgi:hypothetical protein